MEDKNWKLYLVLLAIIAVVLLPSLLLIHKSSNTSIKTKEIKYNNEENQKGIHEDNLHKYFQETIPNGLLQDTKNNNKGIDETSHKGSENNPKDIDNIIKIPEECEPMPFPDEKKTDPFWDDIAFVIRTGKNVAEDRFISGHLTWHTKVKNIVYVSDQETEPYTYVWRGRNISMPKMWDGVYPFAPEGDISLTTNAWYKDFVKHLGALEILYKQHPNMTYYIMADDDTYFFLEHLKVILEDPVWEPRAKVVLMALCYPIDFNNQLHSCDGKFPPNSYFTAGGAGIVMSKITMDTMVPIFPHCYEAYKTCWAGDRRLGACLMDAGIHGCNKSTYSGRDLIQSFSGRPTTHVTSLHKMSNKQFLLLDWIERMANPPGWVADDYLMGYWEFLKNNSQW